MLLLLLHFLFIFLLFLCIVVVLLFYFVNITLLLVPGVVTTFKNTSKTDETLYFEWLEPENTGGLNITKYHVSISFLCVHIYIRTLLKLTSFPSQYGDIPRSNFECNFKASAIHNKT